RIFPSGHVIDITHNRATHDIHLSQRTDLLQDRLGLGLLRLGRHGGEAGDRDRGKNADDDDHDHELDQREALAVANLLHFCVLRWDWFVPIRFRPQAVMALTKARGVPTSLFDLSYCSSAV